MFNLAVKSKKLSPDQTPYFLMAKDSEPAGEYSETSYGKLILYPTITTALSDNALYIKVKRMGLSLGSLKASK
jgi:hypothetical protein